MKKIQILLLLGLVVISYSVKAQDAVVNAQPADILSNTKQEEFDTNQVYYKVEQMPQFPGGEIELLRFIYSNLRMPSIDDGCPIQGKVICRFIIDIDGSVTKPEVNRGLDRYLDAEALKVIRLLPKFIPGKQNGKNVRVWYTIPITFKLE
ncbi:MAG: energy transducer TonB [Paludibacter sp.]